MTRRTQSFPPGLGALRVVTVLDTGPAPGPVTAMKSEAAVGADQSSAPHSSPGVLMASDNPGGDRQAPARCSAGELKAFMSGELQRSAVCSVNTTVTERVRWKKSFDIYPITPTQTLVDAETGARASLA